MRRCLQGLALALAPVLPTVACAPDPFDTAFVERSTAEVRAALEEGAGIVLREAVPIVVLTTDEARARRMEYVKSLDQGAGMTAAVDLMADAMFSGRMLGRYLPDEKVVYVLRDVLLDVSGRDARRAARDLFPVLAHELVHAYDDQVYGVVPRPDQLEDMVADPSRLPELQALMSLLEGRATYASELACEVAGREPMPVPTLEAAREAVLLTGDGSLTGDVLAGLGNTLGRVKLVQYVHGREFARQAHRLGGEAFFEHVFSHLPLSLEELEDFALFRIRWAEEMEAKMDAEEESGVPDDAEGAP